MCAVTFVLGCENSDRQRFRADPRWSVPPELVIGKSLSEITNNFALLNPGPRFAIKVYQTPDERYAVLTRYAHSGIRSFETYSYERVIEGYWHLRGVQFYHESDGMRVEAVSSNGSLTLNHDGVALFVINSASNQVYVQSHARHSQAK